MQTREIETRAWNGWIVLAVLVAAGIAQVPFWVNSRLEHPDPWRIGFALLIGVVWVFLCFGFFTLQPNVAAVLILFGKYTGTAKVSGWCWANPLLLKKRVSLRAHNLNGQTIKVNDHRGNPIEIAAVVVWRVSNTAQAVFDVEDFASFVAIQSESALRHMASAYPYDTTQDGELSLRGSMDEVSVALQRELQDRFAKAGVVIDEARLSHLAYAPEIAGAMLQRQQAEAVIAARSRIVDGAVGMVEMALEKLESHQTVHLDEERKAAMVSNLLVVLCSDRAVHPVVNTGTLYT
jgi:regulator of protease activity HflC (stomatin/prohibitin superfamily)